MQQAVVTEQIVPEAWTLYFPDEGHSPDDRRAVLLQDLLPRFTSLSRWLADRLQPQQVTGRHRLSIGFEELQKVCSSSEFSAALDLQPVEALACLGAAAHQVLFNPQAQQLLPEGIEPLKIVVRLEGHPSSMKHIRQLKSSSIGKIVSVKGTVVRISAVKPLIQCMTFTCTRCGSEHQMRFPEGIYTPPTGCNLDGCRSKSFKPQKKSAQSLDWQKIRIQELSQADKEEAGRVPRTLEVELTRDLVDSCSAGDVVTVLGIIKVLSTDAEAGGKGSKGTAGKRSLFLLYLDAVSVVNQRGANQSCKDTTDQISQPVDHLPSHQATSFTLRDLHFIVKFSQEYRGQQLKQLVHALCPAIYGHELVKAGVVLALFGGVRKGNDDLASVPVRGDIHCLIVGDPGIGKSQLLKAVDTLTPLGRGQAQLLVGPAGSGKSSLAVDAILGQHMQQQLGQQPVRCVYASVGHSQQEVDEMVEELSKAGAMRNTTVVSAVEGCGLGERYAALCSALSMGERVRDQGGHSFVVLDDISCMGAMWEMISRALASLGPTAMAIATPLNPDQPILPPDTDASEGDEQEGLVEYEGMLVSASAAQRRRFFSSLIQRSAQVHRRLGGGSMTLLAILPGQPAKGERQPAATAEDYPNLTPAQRDKLLAALAKRQPPVAETLPGCVNTEVVEEFMSIADGQLVLQPPTPVSVQTPGSGQQPDASQQQVGASQDGAAPAWQRMTGSNVDVSASVSRIGSRAYPPAMAMLAPSIRFDLAQAVDAQRFGTDRSETGLHHHHLQRAALLRAALAQPVRQPVPLEEQVAQLYALQKGFFDRASPETIQQAIAEAVMHIRQDHSDALERIRRTQCLGPMAEAVLKAALVDVCGSQTQRIVSSL